MKTSDIKKGTRVQLTNGWFATMQDSKKGNIRLATVYGYVTETGSIYAWDIAYAETDEGMKAITLTKAQKEAKQRVDFLNGRS